MDLCGPGTSRVASQRVDTRVSYCNKEPLWWQQKTARTMDSFLYKGTSFCARDLLISVIWFSRFDGLDIFDERAAVLHVRSRLPQILTGVYSFL